MHGHLNVTCVEHVDKIEHSNKGHTFQIGLVKSAGLYNVHMYLFVFQGTMELANTHSSDPIALKVIFSSIVLICKIFYSLTFQVTLQ